MKTLTEIAIKCGAKLMDVFDPEHPEYETGLLLPEPILQSFVDAVNAERGEAVAYERFTEFGWIPLNVTDMQHYVEKGCKIRELYTVPQPPVDQSEYIKRLEDATGAIIELDNIKSLLGDIINYSHKADFVVSNATEAINNVRTLTKKICEISLASKGAT